MLELLALLAILFFIFIGSAVCCNVVMRRSCWSRRRYGQTQNADNNTDYNNAVDGQWRYDEHGVYVPNIVSTSTAYNNNNNYPSSDNMYVVSYYTIHPNTNRYNVTNSQGQNNYSSSHGMTGNNNISGVASTATATTNSNNNITNNVNTHSSRTESNVLSGVVVANAESANAVERLTNAGIFPQAMPGPTDTNTNSGNNYNFTNNNATCTNYEAAANDADATIVYGEAKYLPRPPEKKL